MPTRTQLALLLLLTAIPPARAAEPAPEVWWSFRELHRPSVPVPREPRAWSRNPIDRFILAKLRDNGLSPAPEANRRTLIRRVYLDLIGLPPTPAEVDTFLKDTSPDAYEKVVDRLLASPHFGERQARFWMDVAHFAETHGHDQDRVRPHAWRYRDYLIAAFNADTPYARFVQEQLAADVLFPDRPELTPALGFLAAGPWDESSLRDIREDSIDREIGRYLDRDDIVTTVMNTFQGLTVQCARCHDHKFDPIAQRDYYRLQAVFAGIGRGNVSFETDPVVARKRKEVLDAIAELDREVLRLAAKRTPLQARTLAVRVLREQTRAKLAALPAPAQVYAAAPNFAADGSHKPSPTPRTVRLLKRGDIRKPGDVVEPGTVSCLPGLPGFEISANAADATRRAALAKWLTDANNSLTWRVMANRVWQQHFGRGIVGSPSDFGKMGQPPTHPELLDWLAAELRDGRSPGSLKHLHRLIVTSATYRQQSTHDTRAAMIDTDNKLLWRMHRSRLDAEQVRDSILLVSHRLDRTMGGPSDQQFGMKPGIHVTPLVSYGSFNWDRPKGHRRSVYRFVFRTLPDPMVECLDGADASQLTPQRNESVTAPQALALLNNEFVLVHSQAFATWLEAQTKDRARQIAMACERVWGRPPTDPERKAFAAYARKHGLANLCRVLFNSNEFLFVD